MAFGRLTVMRMPGRRVVQRQRDNTTMFNRRDSRTVCIIRFSVAIRRIGMDPAIVAIAGYLPARPMSYLISSMDRSSASHKFRREIRNPDGAGFARRLVQLAKLQAARLRLQRLSRRVAGRTDLRKRK
jgi:hypothetical protein